MSMFASRRFHGSVLGSLCLACQTAVVEVDPATTGTSTMPGTTAPEIPTTEASDEAPTTGTTTGDTGDDTSTRGGDAETMTPAPGCGDGVVGPDEQCDDGLAGNDDSRYCTSDCTLNVCGDGKLFLDWELCDDGAANSDAYGSVCGSRCEPGIRCGDHTVQPEYETCDLGANNGTMMGDEQGILCDESCAAQRLRGFVTEAAFTGDLGGLFGADLKCRAAAIAAGLAEPARFQAFLSTDDIDAKQRFMAVAVERPYVLVTGKRFADDFAALIESGPLDEGISLTEHGDTLQGYSVATNTAPGGGSFSPVQHCQGWTSADPSDVGRVGYSGVAADSPEWTTWKAEQWWTGITDWPCDKTLFHLYCLEI